MACCSTLSSLSSSLLADFLPKQSSSKFRRHDASFSESSLSDDDYVYGDVKSAIYEELGELLRHHFEALEGVKTQSAMYSFPEDKAGKTRRDEDGDTTSSDEEDIDEDIEDIKVPVELVRYFEDRAELIVLELSSFILNLWERRIDMTRAGEDKAETYTSLRQAIYNAHKDNEDYKDFIYEEYCYKEEHHQTFPAFDLEHLEKAWSKVLEEKEKTGFEMTEEDVDRLYCHTVQLCALLVLGLKLVGLEEMPTDDHRHHRTLGDWIEILLENNCESVNSADNGILTKELLVSIGFDPQSPAIETILARSFATSAQHHIEACEWAQIFIKDEFKYNPLLSPAIADKFPLQSDSSNMWFPLPSIAEGERYEDIYRVNIMNLATKESDTSTRNIHSVLRGSVSQDERNVVLFHGTDHQSAKNILDRGIYLCAGRQKRDFSCGKGFYLTNSLDEALNWAKSTTAKPAIVTFQVNREYFHDASKLNLFAGNERRWHEIVSSYRSGRRTAKTRKSLSSYDLIEGPMATVMRGETSDRLVLEPKPSSYQMCLISDVFAEKFQQTLHSVLFIDIS